ncbi:hypothetical protein BT96DRAFT_1002288 [Gymnopus androsaceus JB14]|uniref:Uncharacterized protein n=1 Tax=Gymnopus androsaceus JB14 TaxID=1447944 RepID=A0A6A4GXD1_9AGAR|nr:hypothetical protein BT96DRAFT_1002288 [Gymnopus androsaceus JB14]
MAELWPRSPSPPGLPSAQQPLRQAPHTTSSHAMDISRPSTPPRNSIIISRPSTPHPVAFTSMPAVRTLEVILNNWENIEESYLI